MQLNFTILNPAVNTSLTIINATNAIGQFENHSNDPRTGIIINQPLTAPENIGSIPFPVELSSFTASVKESLVDLKWQTATEVDNYGFKIERKINEGEWITLGFVEGDGNSNSPKNYSFTDNDLFEGGSEFQYRLK